MKFVAVLCLMTSMTFLTACEVPNECSWSEPILFDKETKDWLGSQDWPPQAYEDFNKIGDHNELHDRFCG